METKEIIETLQTMMQDLITAGEKETDKRPVAICVTIATVAMFICKALQNIERKLDET